MPTSPECLDCLLIGIHSRIKRIYYRIDGKYKEIGWFCPSCCKFTLDEVSYMDDMNRIYGMGLTSEQFQKNLRYTSRRIAALKKVSKQLTFSGMIVSDKNGKNSKQLNPDEDFAE